ncbi:MAG: hypothetical protein P4L22_02780 [Candidatus Babeliales bacterium]|nr:hypothetical protein [Candidatus Babeliales bacterium]
MKKLFYLSFFVALSLNCAQGNPPGGPALDNAQQVPNIQPPVIVIERPALPVQPVVDKIKQDYAIYASQESRHHDMVLRVKDEFVDKIRNLSLQDKKVIEKYIRAYISALNELFILRKSTDLDYEFLKANFNYIFAEKQQETVNILSNNPNLYPIVQKLSAHTKHIVDTMPQKGFALRQVSPDTKFAFECLKKLYVAIHIELLGFITCDLVNLDNPKLFSQFLKWYKECHFYYLKNDKVFAKILEILQLQRARYAKALESKKIEAQAQHAQKLDGLLSKDFSKQIVNGIQSNAELVTADSYSSGFSLFRASEDDKLKAKVKVWQAKFKFYDDCEKLLISIINSHNIQAKL